MARQVTVPNIHAPGAKVVFVVESPHVDEVRCGFPLAGSAGRAMSRRLLECGCVPFGLVALEPRVGSRLGLGVPVSVVNVSQEPLQASAYPKGQTPAPDEREKAELKRRVRREAITTLSEMTRL